MTKFAITGDIRTPADTPAYLRKSKQVPGVVYGKSQDPISLILNASEFLRLYRNAGESSIINLKVGKEDLEVLIHATQKHPVTGDFTHVDFYAITRGEDLQTKISLNFVGSTPITKEGAIVEEHMKEIEVKCRPSNLVDHFDVDISVIKEVGDTIRIADLAVDREKYDILHNEDDLIVGTSLPRASVEEETEDAVEEETEANTEAEEK